MGRVWQIVGIVGTMIFVALWFSDRLHLMPEGGMQGGGSHENAPLGDFPRSNMPGGIIIGGIALPIEICQMAFVGLYIVLGRSYPKK